MGALPWDGPREAVRREASSKFAARYVQSTEAAIRRCRCERWREGAGQKPARGAAAAGARTNLPMMGWRDSKSAASSIICWMGGGCEVRGGAAATGSIRSETSVGTFVALDAGGVEAAPEGTTLPVRPVGKVAEDRPSRVAVAVAWSSMLRFRTHSS